jgi:hypothetical protein
MWIIFSVLFVFAYIPLPLEEADFSKSKKGQHQGID